MKLFLDVLAYLIIGIPTLIFVLLLWKVILTVIVTLGIFFGIAEAGVWAIRRICEQD